MHHQRQRRGLFLGGNTQAPHVFRQTRFGLRDAVLHLHLRLIRIGSWTSGYSLTGSSGMAINPVIKIRIDRTAAKIGLSMKKREKSMGWILRSRDQLRALAAVMATVFALTGIPGINTFCNPSTMTLSPGFSPCRTMRKPSARRPGVMSRRCAFPSLSTI